MIDDRELARLFQGARHDDERRAPGWSQLQARPAPLGPSRPARALRWRLASALALLVLFALAVRVVREPAPAASSPTPEAKAFSSQPRWVGPTDFLLEPPSPQLWRSTPTIGRPLPALEAGSAEPTKGTRT